MTDDTRLAAYLSGDLDPDERADVARRLASDPALRARADRIAATDELLSSLPDVELPEGFSNRLAERLAPELDAILGDELAAARARRFAGRDRWMLGAAAAAVAVVVGAGVILSGTFPGGSDGDTTALSEFAPEAQREGMVDDMAAGSSLPVPQIVALGRALTEQDLQDLASDGRWDDLAAPDLGVDQAREISNAYSAALTATSDAAAEEDGSPEKPAPADGGEFDTATSATSEQLAAVAVCLPTVLDSDDQPVIPLYSELATFQGEDVVVFTLAAPGPDDVSYRRIEVWVLTVDGCETRYFTQYDR